MAATHNVLTDDADPGIMSANDERIPEDVRARYGDYDKTVASVVPVIGIQREEWWLFDDDGTLVDVFCKQA